MESVPILHRWPTKYPFEEWDDVPLISTPTDDASTSSTISSSPDPNQPRHVVLNTVTVESADSNTFRRRIVSKFRGLKKYVHSRECRTYVSTIALAVLLVLSIRRNNQYASEFKSLVRCESCRNTKVRNSHHSILFGGSGVELSDVIKNGLGDIEQPFERKKDVPIFLHIPRSGGMTIQDIFGSCLHLVQTANYRFLSSGGGGKEDQSLRFIQDSRGNMFLNVDTTRPDGIANAKQMQLVESNLVDVIITQSLTPAVETLFEESSEHKARLFLMIRHPVERVISLFHYLGTAHWDPDYDPDLPFISMEMFARSHRIDNNNFLVRSLCGLMNVEDEVTAEHLQYAKLLLRTKALVGLWTEKVESLTRFETYFGWKLPDPDAYNCQDKLLTYAWSNKNVHPVVDEDTPAWELLVKRNELDLELYDYARALFVEQERMIKSPKNQFLSSTEKEKVLLDDIRKSLTSPKNQNPAPEQQQQDNGEVSELKPNYTRT